MSILGDAKKRLQDAGILKQQTELNDYYTSLPGTRAHADYATREGLGQPIDNFGNAIGPSAGVEHTPYKPTCPEGYIYNPETNACDPIQVTDATPRSVRPTDEGGDGGGSPVEAHYVNAEERNAWVGSGFEHGYYGTIQDAIKDAEKGNPKAKAAIQDFLAKDPRAGRKSPSGLVGKGLEALLGQIPGHTTRGIPRNRMDLFNQALGTNYSGGPSSDPNAYSLGIENTTGGVPDSRTPEDIAIQNRIAEQIRNDSNSSDDNNNSHTDSPTSGDSGLDNSSSDGAGGAGWTNQGGPISYNNQGGFPGGPLGTDTVPTWLTPEEFVIDRDSTKAVLPMDVKEQLMHANTGGEAAKIINDYEPSGGYEGALKDLDELINKVGFATGRSV